MTRRQRLFVGIASVGWLPVLATVAIASSSADEGSVLATILAVLGVAVMLMALAAVVMLIRHVYTSNRHSDRGKTFWTAILVVFNAFAAPFYWALHIMGIQERTDR